MLAFGFAGVMLVVKPGFGATPGMGFALAAGVFYGVYLALTRAVAGDFRPRLLLITQLMVGTILLAPLGLAAPMPSLSASLSGLILVSALGSALGNYFLVIANRRAEASLIAPLIYTQLISATLVGVMLFDEMPDALGFAGLGLILFSGLGGLLMRRKKTHQKAP